MSGRGDNNKSGSAGRGAGNQSNQAFVTSTEKAPASNHSKTKTGRKPSSPQKKSGSTDAARNTTKSATKK